MKTPLLAAACLLLCSGAISAEVAPIQPPAATAAAASCPPNAALLYWRTWNGRVPLVWEARYLEQERVLEATWQPSAQVVAQLEAAQSDIANIMKAARMDYCEWGLPIEEEGYDAAVPHIARLRPTARVLFADYKRLSAAGDKTAAAERLATLIYMSRQLRNDRTIFSVRAAQSFAIDFAIREIIRLADAKLVDDASKAIFLEALAKVGGPDPSGMREALQQEPIIIRGMIQRLCQGPDAVQVFLTKFTSPRLPAEVRDGSGILQLDGPGLLRATDQAVVMYQEVLANWELPDSYNQTKGIQQQRANGDYGPVARLAGVEDIAHMRRIVLIYENAVKEATAKLKGEATPTANPNP